MIQTSKISDSIKYQEDILKLYTNIDQDWKYINIEVDKKNTELEMKEIEEKELWNNRIYESKSILINLMQYDNENRYITYYKENESEYPVGTMETSIIRGEFYIELLVTHPGTYGVGKTLIEKAVNESTEKGFNGIVNLITEYKNAKEIYTAMEFKETKKVSSSNEIIMTLNPSDPFSEKWISSDNNKWKLIC